MLSIAFVVLAAASALGSTLAVLYLRGRTAPPAPLAATHELFGIGGVCCLILSLSGPPRGSELGVASFGAMAALLIALAAFAGLGVLLMRRRGRRRTGALIALHAMLAVSGFVLLAAYILV